LIGAPWSSHHPSKGVIMPAGVLTYTSIAERLGFSSEAARALVNRWRLPRRRANNSNAIMAEVNHTPMLRTLTAGSPDDHPSVVAPLMARIETLEAELAELEATSAVHRADFERERERCERLMAEILKATAELMAAREATARIAGELAAFQARPWWRRLVG
jgi:hypothetical protein